MIIKNEQDIMNLEGADISLNVLFSGVHEMISFDAKFTEQMLTLIEHKGGVLGHRESDREGEDLITRAAFKYGLLDYIIISEYPGKAFISTFDKYEKIMHQNLDSEEE